MSAATHLLAQAIEDQEAKLEALRIEWDDVIKKGEEAWRLVDAQVDHVAELREALTILESVGAKTDA